MIIPPWVYGAGGLIAVTIGFTGGWVVRDWKHDSEMLAQFENAAKNLDAARVVVADAATAYEQEKQDAVVIREAGEHTIRETYRERVVPADCAVVPAAASVLNDAVAAANARASGQPGAAMPRPAASTPAADRP